MAKKDYYEILGVSKQSSDEEIKRAYRKMAQKHHPDRNKGDSASEGKFKEVNEAYETLSDKQKRAQYDRFGTGGFEGGGFGQGQSSGFGGGFDANAFSGASGFADIFETFFGGGMGSRGSQRRSGRGSDIEVALDLTFEQAVFGLTRELRISAVLRCSQCDGKGAAPGSRVVACESCHGSGSIRSTQSTFLGTVTTARTCTVCDGEGKIPENPCASCGGKGVTRGTSKIGVKIPAGVQSGSTIRVSGKGNAGVFGNEAGDLFVHLNVMPSDKFERRNYDVYGQRHIHILQAIAGDEVDVETVHGPVKLKIPAGTQSHSSFKLKDYGVPHLKNTARGDHIVQIVIDVPKRLSKREKELYGELAREAGLDIKPDEKGFFKRFL